MTISQLMLAGDSIPGGKIGGFQYGDGGQGIFAELVSDRLSNIAGIGPQLGPGIIGCWRSVNHPEWAYAGSWTDVVSTDAFDKLPYGFGKYSAAGSTAVATFTKPTQWRPIVGFELGLVDYPNAGNWQYRVDNGAWVNMGQTIAHDNGVKKLYVASAVTSTVDVRAYDGAGSVGCFPGFIQPFWTDPRSATAGFILHNIAYGGLKLNDLTTTTSGDRLAIVDSVVAGTGSPITNRPNVGVVNLNINDVLLASTSTWNTDLTTLNTRVAPLGPVGFINAYECSTGVYNQTQQTNYRAQTKTTATALSTPKVLDLYDWFSAKGWTGNSAISGAGMLFDLTHPSQLGYQYLAEAIYWFIRNQILGIGAVPSTYVASAKQAAVVYAGKLAAVQYSAGAPIGVG